MRTVKTDQPGQMPWLIWVFARHTGHFVGFVMLLLNWTASSKFGTYRLCEQRRFRRACASAQSRQNLRCSLMQEVSQEEPSDRKPDPLPLWMARHAQLKFVMMECSKTQIRLTGINCPYKLTSYPWQTDIPQRTFLWLALFSPRYLVMILAPILNPTAISLESGYISCSLSIINPYSSVPPERGHAKYKWVASWQNQQSDCAPCEDSVWSESSLSAWRKLEYLATH